MRLGSHSTVSQCLRLEGLESELADMDRPVVLDQHDRFDCPSRMGTEQVGELLEVSDEVAAALGRARMHDQLARDLIERADDRHFLAFPAPAPAGPHRARPTPAPDKGAKASLSSP